MRTLPRVFCCVLAACTPEVAPVLVPEPAQVVEPAAMQPRDYDVLLDVTEDLRVRARMFPDAPITSVEVLAFASAGAAPVTAWKAERGGDASPVAAGTVLELGALPSGWLETSPFVAPVSGTTWVVTLKAVDGEGRTTRFLSDTRVQPMLRVDRGDGVFVVETVPAVPVSRVTLRGADAGVLWEGRSPGEGATIPSGGLVIGDAPSTWDARRFPTAANLVSGQRYTIEVATADTVLATDALFIAGQPSVMSPIAPVPTSHPIHDSSSGWTMGRVFETRGGAVAAFRAVPSGWGVPAFYAVHPAGSSRVVLDATPFTQDVGQAYLAALAPARTLWAQSRIVSTEGHRVAFAAVYSSNRTTPGRVWVVERPEAFPYMVPTYWFEDAWNVIAQPVGPALPATSDVTVHLARGVVTGLAQHAKSPWIVAITNRTKPSDFTLAALDTTSAW